MGLIGGFQAIKKPLTAACFSGSGLPGVPLFRELFHHTPVHYLAVVVEQYRDLGAVTVIAVAILCIELFNPFGGVRLAVPRGVPRARGGLQC